MRGKYSNRAANRRAASATAQAEQLAVELSHAKAKAQSAEQRARYVLGLEAEVAELHQWLKKKTGPKVMALESELEKVRTQRDKATGERDRLMEAVKYQLMPIVLDQYRQLSGLKGAALLRGAVETFDRFVRDTAGYHRDLLPSKWLGAIQYKEIH